MQEIMRIGDNFVPTDDDIKAIGHASTEITDVARKYKTDVLAVVGKGDGHHIVTQYHETNTMLETDIIKAISLVESIAETYNVDAKDIADAIKIVIDEK